MIVVPEVVKAVATTPTSMPMDDVQFIFWAIGSAIAAISAGGSLTWWLAKQHTQTRKDLYTKMGFIESSFEEKVVKGRDVCTNTKERVGLLEQSHNHLEKRIDGIDIKMDNMQVDVTAIKDNFAHLQQKQSENHLTLVGEIRNVANALIIKQLQHDSKRD